jgi:nicotinate-nucleotide adenylyltransferase
MYDHNFYLTELKKYLSDKRYDHSVNVANAAVKLAKIYGEDTEKAYIAGLLHDIAKEMSTEEHFEIFKKEGLTLKSFEKVSPKVLHGPAGSLYIKENFKITDKGILDAVWYHTTGRENMTLLEKIVFVADYISDERDFADSPQVRKMAETNLDGVVLRKLSTSMKKCINFRQAIHSDTVNAYNQMVCKKGDVLRK